jgi:hypothetical protein
MEDNANSAGRPAPLSDVDIDCKEEVVKTDERNASQPISQHVTRKIGDNRRPSDEILDEKNAVALVPRHFLHTDMSLWLGSGHADAFIKYPVAIGHTERELLYFSTYYISYEVCN